MKTEVYSWRLSAELKTTLEQEARRRKMSVSAALDTAVHEWIEHSRYNSGDEDQQQRLRSAALECVGSISSGRTNRAENARQLVRERLQRKRT